MSLLNILDSEIEAAETVLLPDNCRFSDCAKEVICCWDSADVTACPGSSKTTVLLAKLKILADKMPLGGGAGVCVLSHTNVAVNEIKSKLPYCTETLMRYPNYVGTIQSFVDQFVTMPYIKNTRRLTVRPIDDKTYAKQLLYVIQSSNEYKKLLNSVKKRCLQSQGKYPEEEDFIQNLYVDEHGRLRVRNQKKQIAGSDKDSTKQFHRAVEHLLQVDGIIRYQDTYRYAKEAIDLLGANYTELFARRFKYVFIDEYQDCHKEQRDILDQLFNPTQCCVMRIGDPDQAIYDFQDERTEDWIPKEGSLHIESSCRYSQPIADILVPLKKDAKPIETSAISREYKPVLIVFDSSSIQNVLRQFLIQLDNVGLDDPNGKYWAVGSYERVSGLKISDYWNGYNASLETKKEYNYRFLIETMCDELTNGNLFRAEAVIRKVLCRILHFIGIKNPETSSDYNIQNIRGLLRQKYSSIFYEHIKEICHLPNFSTDSVDAATRKMINSLCAEITGEMGTDVFIFQIRGKNHRL